MSVLQNKKLKNLTKSERLFFMSEYNANKKSSSLGVLAAFFGGFGAHHFYLKNYILGITYLLFCLTYIPAVISFFEIFLMPSRVRKYNLDLFNNIYQNLEDLRFSDTNIDIAS